MSVSTIVWCIRVPQLVVITFYLVVSANDMHHNFFNFCDEGLVFVILRMYIAILNRSCGPNAVASAISN